MASALTNYFGNAILTRYFSMARWLVLFTNDPGVTGSFADEVAGGSYVRQRFVATSPSTKSIGNSNAIIFDNLPACTVTYMGLADTQYTGNLFLKGSCTPLVVPNSGRIKIGVGDVVFTL